VFFSKGDYASYVELMAEWCRHYGLAMAGYPLRRAERMLADLAIGDRLVKEADGGRRREAIQETPSHSAETA